MTTEFARLVALVDAYLASGDFMTLWSPIAGIIAFDREPGPFAPSEGSLWDELYEVVYMGQQDSATPGEAKDGLLGGIELQSRLRAWRAKAVAALSGEGAA